MKKIRILAALLVLAMMIAMLPAAALAAEADSWYAYVEGLAYNSGKANLGDQDKTDEYLFIEHMEKTGTSATISAKDYQKVMMGSNGAVYELIGMHAMTAAAQEKADKTGIANGNTSITVKPAPSANDYKTEEEYLAAYDKWSQDNANYVILAYAPHEHAYDGWKTSATNHWRYCYECKENFLEMNWHSDADRDGKCDECEMDIVYYDITIAEATGGKVTEMEGDKDSTAPYNRTIVIHVEADDGYIVKDVRFYKVRKDGSKSQIMRTIITPGEDYSFVMPNFDVEIVATYAEA